MHDSVQLETLGVPTAVVVTSEFLHEAHVQRAALGMNDLDPVVITHPLSTLTDQQINQRIEQAVTMARQIWLGGR
ncbi:MAG: hypothetical protein O2967_03010 [Proteobacteria bacterium]|nr:hypothetical protein [Pseudomonadota bacterium]